MGDLRIDTEASNKALDRLEQVDKRVMARIDALGRLIRLGVTRNAWRD